MLNYKHGGALGQARCSSSRLKNTERMASASRIHKAVLCDLIIGQILLIYKRQILIKSLEFE